MVPIELQILDPNVPNSALNIIEFKGKPGNQSSLVANDSQQWSNSTVFHPICRLLRDRLLSVYLVQQYIMPLVMTGWVEFAIDHGYPLGSWCRVL